MNTVTIVELIAFAALSAAVLILTVKVLAGPLRPSFAPHSRPSDKRPRETVQSVVPASQDAAGTDLDTDDAAFRVKPAQSSPETKARPQMAPSEKSRPDLAAEEEEDLDYLDVTPPMYVLARNAVIEMENASNACIEQALVIEGVLEMAYPRAAVPHLSALRDTMDHVGKIMPKEPGLETAFAALRAEYRQLLLSLDLCELCPEPGEVYDENAHRVAKMVGNCENSGNLVVAKTLRPGYAAVGDGFTVEPALVSVTSVSAPAEKSQNEVEEAHDGK